MADRAWSNKRPERWADPPAPWAPTRVRPQRLRPRRPGPRRSAHGRRLPHCPAMPAHLHNVAPPPRYKVGGFRPTRHCANCANTPTTRPPWSLLRPLIAERHTYAFRRVAGAHPGSPERFECPAQAGKVRCQACPCPNSSPATALTSTAHPRTTTCHSAAGNAPSPSAPESTPTPPTAALGATRNGSPPICAGSTSKAPTAP